MTKWVFYVLVFVYMCYRAVYGARVIDTSISVEEVQYEEKGYLEVGTRKTINCKASNKNQKLEWVDSFGNVVKRIPSNRVYAQEHFVSIPKGNRSPGLVLTFSELMVSDTGEYQCKSGDDAKKTVRVCVIKPSEFVDSDSIPAQVTIETGRSITLVCQASGDPEPTIVWTRNEEELTEGIEHPKYKVNKRFKIQGYESLLTIFSVEPEDAGEYQCKAVQESVMLDSCTATNVRNITLQVNYEPVFSQSKETAYVYGKTNEVVDIKCNAKGWPKPTYRWFKDLGGGALYEFNKSKIVFSEEDNTATLSVTALPTTYGNTYKCSASNVFGETDKYFILLNREKPRKAENVVASIVGSDRTTFNVTWDQTVHFPIDNFRIQYIPSSKVKSSTPDKSVWENAKTVVKAIEEDETDDDDSTGILVELEDLKPETSYFARLRAENEAGEANWSEYVEFTTISVTESNTEEAENDINETENDLAVAAEVNSDGGMFYGIFFTGGILIIAVVCMFAMRIV